MKNLLSLIFILFVFVAFSQSSGVQTFNIKKTNKESKNTPVKQDVKYKTSTKNIGSGKSHFNIAKKDETAPLITIISPEVTRGSKKEITDKLIQVTGKVKDESGIFEVVINKVEAVVANDGTFQAMVPLAYGDNKITVKATDINYNTSRSIFTVVRKSGEIAKNIPTTSVSAAPVVVAKAGINLEIAWQNPVKQEISTSVKEFPLQACVNTNDDILEIAVYVNSELNKKCEFGKVDFRGKCDFFVNENITLVNGKNEIVISVKTVTKKYHETRIVNYNFIDAKYYALVIGIQDYDDEKIADLSHPIEDAQKLVNVLTSEYTFEKKNIVFLENPTKGEIIGSLHKMRSYITEKDNLLIFYAGHGYWDEGMKVGYWFPSDSDKDTPINWFPNTDLTNYLSAINTKHTLLIADACFSGGIFKTRKAFNKKQVIERLYQLPSRKAITSGTLKEVPDVSVFIEYLLKRLNSNEEKYLTSEELFSSMRKGVMNNSDNIPQFGTIKDTGDEGGDFIFIKK